MKKILLVWLFEQLRQMWTQTKIEDFAELKTEKRPEKEIAIEYEEEDRLELILERLDRIENLIQAGSIQVSMNRPIPRGKPPQRLQAKKQHESSALAKELKELMGIEKDEILLGGHKQILAKLRETRKSDNKLDT